MVRNLRGMLGFLALILVVRGQIPSEENCLSALESADAGELQTSLTPCAFGASPSCCRGLSELVAFNAETEFAGCLCNKGVLDVLVDELEANTIAQSIGFDGARLIEIFETCGVPFYGKPECIDASPSTPTVNIETDGVAAAAVVLDATSAASFAVADAPISSLRAGLLRQSGRQLRLVDSPLVNRGIYEAGSGYRYNGAHERIVNGYQTTDSGGSSFEDARKKFYVIRNNLKNTYEILTNTALDKAKATVEHKTSSPAWIEYENNGGPLRNGDVVKLVPVDVDDYLSLENAIPVQVDLKDF